MDDGLLGLFRTKKFRRWKS